MDEPQWIGLQVPDGVSCDDTSDCSGKLEWEGGEDFVAEPYVVGAIAANNENDTACMLLSDGVRCTELKLPTERSKKRLASSKCAKKCASDHPPPSSTNIIGGGGSPKEVFISCPKKAE